MQSSREGLAAASQRVTTAREGGGEIKSEGRRNGGREDERGKTKGGTGGRKGMRLSCQTRKVDEGVGGGGSVTLQKMQKLSISLMHNNYFLENKSTGMKKILLVKAQCIYLL